MKEIATFKLTDKTKDFEILIPDFNSIYFLGSNTDYKVSNINVNLITPDKTEVNLTAKLIKYSYFRKGVRTFEKWQFKAIKTGSYQLKLSNLEEFIPTNTLLISPKIFNPKKKGIKSLNVFVKQS